MIIFSADYLITPFRNHNIFSQVPDARTVPFCHVAVQENSPMLDFEVNLRLMKVGSITYQQEEDI